MPAPAPAVETVASAGGSVVVQSRQTLYGVARQTGVPLRALIEANGLTPPYHVHTGQTLIVPHIRQHLVQPGETLYGVSRRFGVEATTLVRLNHLQAPYVIKRGMALILPPEVSIARAGTPMPQNPAAAGPEVAFNNAGAKGSSAIESAPLAPVKTPPLTSSLAAGPGFTGSGKPVGAIVTGAGAKPPMPVSAATAAAPSPVASAALAPLPTKTIGSVNPAVPPAAASKLQDDGAETDAGEAGAAAAPTPTGIRTAAVASAGSAAAAVRGHRSPTDPIFYWPARGTIIAVFGPTRAGTHNDGINIAAPEGTIISAAESGVVAYAGDQLKGFGNLLLIKHDGGWVSAYAHNQVLLVAKGDRVRRGQPIARVGSTGGVGQPQLHFELREGVKAVDPLDHLPQLAAAG